MKKHLIGLSIFILAFFAGMAFIPSISDVTEPEFSNQTEIVVAIPQTEAILDLETIYEVGSLLDEETNKYPLELLETGDGFDEFEVKAKSGENWLGLFREKQGYFLRHSKLDIQRYHSRYDGDNRNTKTGRRVSVKGRTQPLFLLKNTKRLKESKVSTVFQGPDWVEALKIVGPETDVSNIITSIKEDFDQNYKFGGKNYRLKVIAAKNKNNEKILALALENAGIRQILHTVRYKEYNSIGDLYWVGDLDHDSVPDFYFSTYENDNYHITGLFLSSYAEKGKFVKKVAGLWLTSKC